MQDLKIERGEAVASNLDGFDSEEVQSLDVADAGISHFEEDGGLGFVLFLLASFPHFVQLQWVQV